MIVFLVAAELSACLFVFALGFELEARRAVRFRSDARGATSRRDTFIVAGAFVAIAAVALLGILLLVFA